jgi:hypothetical protein
LPAQGIVDFGLRLPSLSYSLQGRDSLADVA